MLRLIHTLLGLHKQLLQSSSAATLSVLLLPLVSLQAAAAAMQSGHDPVADEAAPICEPLIIDGKESRLRVAVCTRIH